MKTTILLLILLALIVGGMFMFAYEYRSSNDNVPTSPDVGTTTQSTTTDSTEPPAAAPSTAATSVPPVTLERSYADGVLTVSGAVTTPTPCHTVAVDTIVLESYPEQVVLDVVVTPSDTICTQVLAEQSFTATATVARSAKVSLQINGAARPVQFKETSSSTAVRL